MKRLFSSILALAVLSLTACPPAKETGDTGTADGDLDGDGYAADDCDDTNPDIHPGAAETCDGIDQDCDGTVDEDASGGATWYADTDGDGYGDPAVSEAGCEAPAGYVAGNTDCDDTRADMNPGAAETCDGFDNDCDGAVDEDAGDGSTWYADTDGDGYGDPSTTTTACQPPAGWVADATDCNDTSAAVHPEATEVCDGEDNDCDGLLDDGDPDVDLTGMPTWYYDRDGDGWGDGAEPIVACTVHSGMVSDGTDCDDSNADVHPGAPEVCGSLDDDCDGLVDADDPDLDTTYLPTWYVDADVDGWGDAADPGVVSCSAPTSTSVMVGFDCNDADATINPAAVELCDDADVDEDCDGFVDDLDPEGANGMVTWYADEDLDGHGDSTVAGILACAGTGTFTAVTADDCDDTNAAVNPDAAEVCNTVDDNCDGATDEGVASTWYLDADADGYGDPSITVESCDFADGYASNGLDCDDTRADVNPAAAELCDDADVDEDCDGAADDLDAGGASGLAPYYPDADGDGYGDATHPGTVLCGATPELPALEATDCDDANYSVNPGAAEICDGAAVDEDCDGLADDADTDVPTGAFLFYPDADGDGYGDATSAGSALCLADETFTTTDATDCDDARDDVNPAALEVCDAADTDEDCDGLADDADADPAGRTAWYVDADGDGFGDPATSAETCDATGDRATAVGTDCDDARADVNPDAQEACDAADTDEDCDGFADDGDPTVDTGTMSTFFPDADGDGRGDATSLGFEQCDPTATWATADATDCDDARADVNPDAAETCDAADVDEDCDGAADDLDAGGALGTTPFYPDTDGDGYGDAASAGADRCDASTDWPSVDASDCDDAAASVHPTAPETCDDTVDQDCNGADEVCPYPHPTWCTVQYPVTTTTCSDSDTEMLYGRVYDEGYTPGDGPATSMYAEVGWGPAGTDPAGAGWTWTEGTYNMDYGNDDEWMASLSITDDGTFAFAWRFSGNGADWLYCDTEGSGPTDPYDPAAEATLLVLGDGDDDGYLTLACDGDDCDDDDATVHPDAGERCDDADVDEDCDGLVEDADSDVTGQTTWYADMDGDGFGTDEGTSTLLCDPVDTWSAVSATDCDDDNDQEYPGGVEVDDDNDNDCDDMVDEGFRTDGDIVISELMYNPSSSEPNTEWIEVYNPSPTRDLHLDGSLLYTSGGGGKSFYIAPDSLVVPAGGTAVLCHSDTTISGLCDYMYGSDVNGDSDLGATYNASFGMTNPGSTYAVRFTLDGTTVGSVTYGSGSPWPTSKNGYAIELSNLHLNGTDDGDGSWWCQATTLFWTSGTYKDYGTPNATNACATP